LQWGNGNVQDVVLADWDGPMITGLLYVSRSNLQLPRQRAEVDAIVAEAQARNATMGVTGALVFTERLFAQYLEGADGALEILMDSIGGDPRHSDVVIVYQEAIPARRFETWELAYAGPSTFVAGNVWPLTEQGSAPARRKAAERLIKLMGQFVEAHLIEQRRNSARG
jgi:hypothetical protein